MARTIRRGHDKRGNVTWDQADVRPWYRRERKWARKMTNRKARNRANEALRTINDPDALVIDRNPSTGGWVSH